MKFVIWNKIPSCFKYHFTWVKCMIYMVMERVNVYVNKAYVTCMTFMINGMSICMENLSNMHDIYSRGKDANLWMKSIRLWDGNGGLVLAQGWREVKSLWDGVYLSGCTLTAEGKNMNSSILWCSQGGGHPLADLAINNILKEKTLTSYIFLATYMNHL